MQYYKTNPILSSRIFVISRETNKTVFFRRLKPYKELNKYEMKYEYFDLDNPIIDTESEYKLLKRTCQMIPLKPHEIDHINNSVIFDRDMFQPRENHFLNVYSASELNEYNYETIKNV